MSQDWGGDFAELDELFPDPEDRRLAAILTSIQAPEVTADPAFRSQLRRELMQEAWGRGAGRKRERAAGGGFLRTLFAPAGFAWAGAVAGVVMIALVVFALSHGGTDNTVYATYNVDTVHPVAAVQPLEVKFSQPMDQQSTEAAVQITPATQVQYQWTDATTLKITPVSGSFAPNTQYTVNIAPSVAKTASGATVPQVKPAVFTVAPTPAPPTPTPAPTPSVRPTPPPAVSGEHQVAAGATSGLAWLPDGSSLLYIGADGRLMKAGSAAPVPVAGPGVERFAISPDGATVIFATATAVSTVAVDGSHPTPVATTPTWAVGWAGDKPEYVGATAVVTPSGEVPLARPNSPGALVALSPDGSKLWYQGSATAATGKDAHVLDLTSKKVSDWQPAGVVAFLAWSPDSQRVLYSASDGLYVAGFDGSSPVKVSSQASVTSASWTQAPLIVFAVGQALWTVDVAAAKDQQVVAGDYAQPALAPRGRNLGFQRGGALWSGLLLAGTTAVPNLGLDKAAAVVGSFMDARVAGSADQAQGFLDAQARADFTATGGPQLLRPSTPKLSRAFTVLSGLIGGSARFVERLVLADASGKDVNQLDETLTLVLDPTGKILVDHAVDGTAFAYGSGPAVLSVAFDPKADAYTVAFDSDLAAATAAGGVQLVDTAGKVLTGAPAVQGRNVVLTVPSGSTAVKLVVLPALKDKNGHGAASEYDLDLTPLASPAAAG